MHAMQVMMLCLLYSLIDLYIEFEFESIFTAGMSTTTTSAIARILHVWRHDIKKEIGSFGSHSHLRECNELKSNYKLFSIDYVALTVLYFVPYLMS